MEKKVREYKTPQGSKHILFYLIGYNQYYFKRVGGKLHKVLEGHYTSVREADKKWKAYCRNNMTFNRTSKSIKENGEKTDPDFKPLNPTKEFEDEN